MKLEIIHGFVNHKNGDIVTLPTVAKGVPKDLYWRRRIKDAEIDGCVKIVEDAPAPKKRKSEKSDGGNE
jgi:hypothetical protein